MEGIGANPVGTSLKWDLSRESPRLKIFEMLLPFQKYVDKLRNCQICFENWGLGIYE